MQRPWVRTTSPLPGEAHTHLGTGLGHWVFPVPPARPGGDTWVLRNSVVARLERLPWARLSGLCHQSPSYLHFTFCKLLNFPLQIFGSFFFSVLGTEPRAFAQGYTPNPFYYFILHQGLTKFLNRKSWA